MRRLKDRRGFVWAHDIPVDVLDGVAFETGSISCELLDRYIEPFERLTLVARGRALSTEATGRAPLQSHRLHPLLGARSVGMVQRIWGAVGAARGTVARVPSIFGNLAATFAIIRQRPLLCEVVGPARETVAVKGTAGRLFGPVFEAHTRWIVARSTSVLYVTESYLQGRFPAKCLSIACSDVSIEPDERDLEKRLERHAQPLHGAVLRLATVGALDVSYKGQPTVLRAVRLLGDRGIRIQYTVAGTGDAKNLIATAAALGVSDDLIVRGALSRSEVLDLLRSTDIYIQPSQVEGMPRAVLEAMSVACPTCTSNVGGMKDIQPEERLFEFDDHVALARIIESMIGEDLRRDSRRNFATSQRYAKPLLDDRRMQFFSEFREACTEA